MLFGAHESVAGGVSSAFGRAAIDGCRAIQVFTKNSNQWKEPAISAEGIAAFREGRASYGLPGAPPVTVLAHASYLINLGTDDSVVLQKSIDALVAEVERSSALGIDYVVLHPGAHLGAGEDVGLARVCEALDAVHARAPGASARILLENTAGQGTCVGHRFEHLQAIFEGARTADRLGVCFDTQHAFAAGYDLSTGEGYERTWTSLDTCVGLDRVRAFHLNDSKKPLGARVDRHEHLGEGLLGLAAFWRLANDRRFATIPGVLETEPREGEKPFKAEVDLLNGLVGAPEPVAKPVDKAVFALEFAPPPQASRAKRSPKAPKAKG
jgi:deoxyribonuclease-4